jgi:tRNA-2-methylthio-N6-dimethylallyladenosine synthase
VLTTTVTYAAPHHLVADAGITGHRAWRGAETTTAHAAPPQLLHIGRRPG